MTDDETRHIQHKRWGAVDVAYSPDDGGWYCQRWSDDETTSVFPSASAAIARLDDPKPFSEADTEDHRGRCPDCGEPGERIGHQTCQYPQDH